MKEIVKTLPIADVTYPAVDSKNKKLVSLITSDARLGLKYCYVFTMADKVRDCVVVCG